MKGFFVRIAGLTPVVAIFGAGGLLIGRYTLCNSRIQQDVLFYDDLLRRWKPLEAEAVARHIQRQREWFDLPWFRQLVTPVPTSWYKHYIHGEGAYTGGD
jgi:hypothetical protein